jgi:hypothetical protein
MSGLGVGTSPTPKYKLLIEPHLGSDNLIYKNLQGTQKIPQQIFDPIKLSSKSRHIRNASVESNLDQQNSANASKESGEH